MWSLQMQTGPNNGAWTWLNFNYEPWESPNGRYSGAALAAIAVGTAPGYYAPGSDSATDAKVRLPALNGEGPRTERRDAIRGAFEGRGRIVTRARVHIEEMAKGNRNQIIVTELPYQTNKAALIAKIYATPKAIIDRVSNLIK